MPTVLFRGTEIAQPLRMELAASFQSVRDAGLDTRGWGNLSTVLRTEGYYYWKREWWEGNTWNQRIPSPPGIGTHLPGWDHLDEVLDYLSAPVMKIQYDPTVTRWPASRVEDLWREHLASLGLRAPEGRLPVRIRRDWAAGNWSRIVRERNAPPQADWPPRYLGGLKLPGGTRVIYHVRALKEVTL